MKVRVVIPARYGSSRLEGKPLLPISNEPMIVHVVRRCMEAGFLSSDIFVATDDCRIKNELQKLDIHVVMTSLHHTSGTERLNEVAEIFDWDVNDVVINVQGDEPMIPANLIKSVSQYILSHPEYDIATAVAEISEPDDFNNPNVVKAIVGENGRAIYFTRSPCPVNRDDVLDLTFAKRHLGIYAYRVKSLKKFCTFGESALEKYEKLEQLRALSFGMTIGTITYKDDIPHGVDTISDYKNIKAKMESN